MLMITSDPSFNISQTDWMSPVEVILNGQDDEIAISYRQYNISDYDSGNFLRVETNTESIYFGSDILPRVFTLIASGKISKSIFKHIDVDINPGNEFNIDNFEDTIEVQERYTAY